MVSVALESTQGLVVLVAMRAARTAPVICHGVICIVFMQHCLHLFLQSNPGFKEMVPLTLSPPTGGAMCSSCPFMICSEHAAGCGRGARQEGAELAERNEHEVDATRAWSVSFEEVLACRACAGQLFGLFPIPTLWNPSDFVLVGPRAPTRRPMGTTFAASTLWCI